MRVKNLLVMSFGNREDQEIRDVRKGLKAKYAIQVETHFVAAVRAEKDRESGRWTQYDREQWKNVVNGTSGARRDYGAYFVFHYHGVYGCSGLGESAAEEGQLLADWLAHYAFDEYKFNSLDKVCFLACMAARDRADGSESLLDHFCRAMMDACELHGKEPPLVAGYDSIVTVLTANRKSKSAAPSLNTKEHIGQKQIGSQAEGQLARDHRERKFVWVYEQGSYRKVAVTESGWSDKRLHLPTNTDSVATIHMG